MENKIKKKRYERPQLSSHGSVEEITGWVGGGSGEFFGGVSRGTGKFFSIKFNGSGQADFGS